MQQPFNNFKINFYTSHSDFGPAHCFTPSCPEQSSVEDLGHLPAECVEPSLHVTVHSSSLLPPLPHFSFLFHSGFLKSFSN